MNIQDLFRRDTEDARPILVVPFIRDCRDFRQEEKVKALSRKCAEQLAPYLFRWDRQFPNKPTVKFWDASQRRFLGFEPDTFCLFLEKRFRIQTRDGQSWRLDRAIASRIREACVAADSPPPPASWGIELAKQREGKK